MLIPGEGTSGEPEAQAAGEVAAAETTSAQSGEPEAQAADDFWSKVRETPRDKWPEDVRKAAEADMVPLSHHTRRMQETHDQYERNLKLLLERVAPQNASPDERAQLVERVKQGEFDAIPDLVNASFQKDVAPMMEQILKERALSQALANPVVAAREAKVADVLQKNPRLNELAKANGYANAPDVLYAIARDIQAQELEQQLEASKAEIESLKKARSASIPGQTTRAGTPHVPANGKPPEVKSIRDAMRVASEKLGLQIPSERL
jgi:hypothetical protein